MSPIKLCMIYILNWVHRVAWQVYLVRLHSFTLFVLHSSLAPCFPFVCYSRLFAYHRGPISGRGIDKEEQKSMIKQGIKMMKNKIFSYYVKIHG